MAQNLIFLSDWDDANPPTLAQSMAEDWARQTGALIIEQHDRKRPLRGDWISRLEDELLNQQGPVVALAVGLGCSLLAAWAQHSANAHLVRSAWLVAPLTVDTLTLKTRLPSWASNLPRPLPFASRVIRDSDLAQTLSQLTQENPW
jgi:predicted alpha/beta hydrolase family esterase